MSKSKKRTTIRSKWMVVKPSTAERWLRKNSVNRKINEAHVAKLAADMEAGRYLVTHQGVAFDTGGSLLDGQHRLSAIARSCIPQKILVTTGLPPESMAAMDVDSKPRSLANVLEIDGGAAKFGVSPRLLHTVGRALYDGPHARRSMSTAEMREFVTTYADAIAWSVNQFPNPGRGVARSSSLAAIARAYHLLRNKGQVGKISQFALVLNSGVTDGSEAERAIIPLRDRLLKMDGRGMSRAALVEAYAKTAAALDAFLRGVKRGNYDAFRIPSDTGATLDDAPDASTQVAS